MKIRGGKIYLIVKGINRMLARINRKIDTGFATKEKTNIRAVFVKDIWEKNR